MDAVRVIYALQEFPPPAVPSLFLAGPTPRKSYVKSWRPQALGMIRRRRRELAVLYPEPSALEKWSPDADDHINWERAALMRSKVILFWVPRHLEILPGFRTNTEWGFWTSCDPGRLVLGYPQGAPGMNGMRNDAECYRIPVAHSLSDALRLALDKLFPA